MHDEDYSDEYATLGDRIVSAREALGLSASQLSRRLGVKTATLEAWEADRSEPRANKLQMMAGVMNVSLVWLLSGEGAGAPPDAGPVGDDDVETLLGELRSIRAEQSRLAERAGRLEKRLRAQIVG